MNGCPTDAVLTALLESRLPASDAIALREHTLDCPTCGPRLDALESAGPRQRERLGRYVLLGVLGEGGMGRVLRAYDPQLDRKCALKLVRADRASPEAAARLVREAQAMGRVQHPNIVTVFDAGENEGEVFVAMELVEGPTLDDWLKGAPRPWREVVERFCEAGLGLQAAHDAGLVHRDFKPANVMLRDGVAKVTDFGLARPPADGESHSTPAAATDSGSLTLPGLVMGTPAYMSPEQRLGKTDARSDQYSFGVSLFEALHGRRPNGEGPLRPIPRWLATLCARLLEEDPARRFPSMRAVVEALRAGAARQQNRARLAAVLSVVAVVSVAWGFERTVRSDPCQGAAAQLTRVWTDAARDAVHTRLAPAAGLGKEVSRFEGALEGWARTWSATRTEACAASKQRGELSDQLYGLESLCLERRLRQFEAVVRVAAGVEVADPRQTLRHLTALTAELPPLEECARPEALLRQLGFETETEQREGLPFRARLDEARSLSASGLDAKGLAIATDVVGEVAQSQNVALRAEALNVQGDLELRAGTNARARPLLLEAWRLATQARADELALRAWVDVLPLIATDAASLELATAVAEASVDRVGRTPAREATVLYRTGRARFLMGDFAGAEKDFRRAWPLRRATLGPDHPDTLKAASNVAASLVRIGRSEEAVEIQRERYGLTLARYGPDSLITLDALADFASELVGARRDAEARPVLEKVLARLDAETAGDSVTLYSTIDNLAFATLRLGDLPATRRLRDRLVKLSEERFGPSGYLADALTFRAELALHEGQTAQALSDATAGSDGLRAVSATHPDLPWALTFLAEAAALNGDLPRARKALEEAARLVGTTPGEARAMVWMSEACVLPAPEALSAARLAVGWLEQQPRQQANLARARLRLSALEQRGKTPSCAR